MAGSWIKFGPDGLSGYDARGARRIWMDPASTSLSFYDVAGVRRLWLDGLNPGLSFYDANSVRRIFLDAMGMLFSFFDTNGISRCQMGNLPANGVSAAHFGFRVNNASGVPIADSIGLIDVMTSGGFGAGGSGQALAGAGVNSFTVLTGSAFTLTIARPVRIDYRVAAWGQCTGGGNGYFRGNIVGFDTTAKILNSTPTTNGSFMWYFTGPGANFATIPAGTYTVQMEMSADVGSTLTNWQFFHQIFILGA